MPKKSLGVNVGLININAHLGIVFKSSFDLFKADSLPKKGRGISPVACNKIV